MGSSVGKPHAAAKRLNNNGYQDGTTTNEPTHSRGNIKVTTKSQCVLKETATKLQSKRTEHTLERQTDEPTIQESVSSKCERRERPNFKESVLSDCERRGRPNLKEPVPSNSECSGKESFGLVTGEKYVKLKDHRGGKCMINTQCFTTNEPVLCSEKRCMGSIVNNSIKSQGVVRSKEDLLTEAKEFINNYYTSIENKSSLKHLNRWEEIMKSINVSGTYQLTYDELCFGARQAWRNAPRCIGRIQWNNLQVFDARSARNCKDMFDAICRHIRYCTNNGKIRSGITLFPHLTDVNKQFRIWNSQFIRYAGYHRADGTVVGDPSSAEFTEVCQKLGWKGQGTMFDVLPLVLQANGEDPELYELPADIVLEVPLKHPKYSWFEELGLRWYALPAVTNMLFEVGGLDFTACPFSGWYMGTEIGARNLCDTNRYNLTEVVATKMELDTKSPTSLWKDKAIVEVNVAVLYSFQQKGVTISDHHSAAESFMTFMSDEQKLRGGCPADWVWIVPPISGSATPVFHQEMLMYRLKPVFDYQVDAWKTHCWQSNKLKTLFEKPKHKMKTICWLAMTVAILMRALALKRVNCTILYATVTGNALRYARILEKMFSNAFNVKLICMDKYDVEQLQRDRFVLVVTSTNGNGDPPECAMEFAKQIRMMNKKKRDSTTSDLRNLTVVLEDMLKKMQTYSLKNIRYSVFGLGSRAYPNFCSFARFMDTSMRLLGGNCLHDIGEGDALNGQEISFATWAKDVFSESVKSYHIMDGEIIKRAMKEIEHADTSWVPNTYLVMKTDTEPQENLIDALSQFHRKSIAPCILKNKTQLQTQQSSRKTLLVELKVCNNEKLVYQPGDHVGICPVNNAKDVNYILDRLPKHTAVDLPVRVAKSNRKNSSGLFAVRYLDMIPVCSIRSALTHFLDIQSPPTQSNLKDMTEFANDTFDQIGLMKLAQDMVAYKEWRNSYPCFKDVLRQFQSVILDPAFLLTQLPPLKERFYSISSSSKLCPGEIHLTVGLISYKKNNHYDGDVYKGVCSSWLDGCAIGDTIPCHMHLTPVFHMPEDESVPIIMVGAGTGIAPFRSFWQQRKYDTEHMMSDDFGEMYMFFGCRDPSHDDIYASELRQAEKDGIITEVFKAYSREPGQQKVYVQDIMMRQSKLVFDAILKKNGHIYVCGETQMAQGVSETFSEIVQRYTVTSSYKTKKIVQSLRDANHYHEELFGPSFVKQV